MRDADDSTVLFHDEQWTALAASGVPGWVMLLANRHTDGWLWDLAPAEAASYGPMLKALSVAIRTAMPAERVYLIGLGENSLHFHCLLMPRTAETPQDWRGPQLLAHGKDLADPEQALRVATQLRSAVLDNATALSD
jgi:diadenosine tetraphosphate (Ap4A) HIT family hydrolase